ncbi:alpha/beta hydrolase [Undibacterium sp. Jales W-56]|uniref:alpha/beta fold hydrolase n=1 Tax=Undibacterium sp. Jales W-56 TaxID=2897325 RepID=UPI0021D255A9|nr:alpha/beta hydrolase [Undibacterium sp. Jales W-56]MCU6434852.1 alpha/beta hydrolase [Undibacterium sp. Jales W-56]
MTWVLLRGLMRESRHWGDFVTQLKEACSDEVIVTLDFPGNGNLHQQDSARSVMEMAEFCRHELQERGYAPPYKILSVSLGAMVAVAWAEAYPDELSRLVLINTSLAPHNAFYQRLRPKNYAALLYALLFGSAADREKLILRITSKQSGTAHAAPLLKQWGDYAQTCPISTGNILRQLLAALRYRAPAQKPPVALLLLAGERDDLVNPVCSRTLAKKWQCELRLHPTAGHDLPLDDAAWVIRQVRESSTPVR